MKVLIVATIALIGVTVCTAVGPSSQYLPPSFGGSASKPSNQYLAPHGGGGHGGGGNVHYHGVDGGGHAASSYHAPSAASRYGGGGSFGRHGGGAQVPILRNDFTHDVESGNYNFGFETGNGIRRDETGHFTGAWPHGSQSVSGSYSFPGDDGRVYTVNYTADENGFHAEGDHLPMNAAPGGHGGNGHGHGHGHGHGGSGGFGGRHGGRASAHAASGHGAGGHGASHAPSTQYLPPQQQHGGYHYARHRSY